MAKARPNLGELSDAVLHSDLEWQLWAEVQRLGAQVQRLAQENAELRRLLAQALKNSSTSSKPPSSDIVKPPKPPAPPGQKRKRGAQRGHPKHARPPFEEGAIDVHLDYGLEACPECQGALERRPEQDRVVQQVEVVPKPVEVSEHRALAYWCQHCQTMHYAPLPPAVEQGGLLGPLFTAQIAYLKGALHALFSTIRRYVRDVLGLSISRGQLSKIVQKVSEALEGPYEELLARLRGEAFVHVDETGHKDNGVRFWAWLFRTPEGAVFKVSASRGSQALLDVSGREFEGILGCDFFSAYRKFIRECEVRVQFCWAHFIREVKFLTTLADPQAVAYGERLLERFRLLFFALHLEGLSPEARTRALEAVRDALLAESQVKVPEVQEARLVAQRLREHGASYFTFIEVPEIGPTNNAAEQTLRFVVIDRHITQGTRGEKGCRWSERIWTVLATCALQGRSAYDYLVKAVQAHFNGEPAPSLIPNPP